MGVFGKRAWGIYCRGGSGDREEDRQARDISADVYQVTLEVK